MSSKVIQQRWLKPMWVVSVTKTRNDNGTFSETYNEIEMYMCRVNEYMTYGNRNNIFDQVYDYGSDNSGETYRKRYILSSPDRRLEAFVASKMNNSADNIGNYRIIYNDEIFKMIDSKVTIERLSDYNA